MTMPADPNGLSGLTAAEVADRLSRDGYNELPGTERKTVLHTLWGIVQEPMFLLLIACGGLYLVLGDLEEALMLLGFVAIVIGIALYQEQKTERTLEALRDLSSPRALVVRDGQQQRIAGREVVVGDLTLIAEGDRVPADATVLSATNLSVDESLLTGESVPVRKVADEGRQATARPGGDDLPFVYSGTLVVKGQGIARVTATGCRTEVGKIGKALQELQPEQTDLQRQTRRIVRTFALLGLTLCALVVVIYGLTRHDWLHGFLAGVTLAMATLPEEFPVVLTIFLALGAWRIAQRQVLARRVAAVEMLGAATVLCVDKTGTLTRNQMTVTCLAADGMRIEVQGDHTTLPDGLHEVVEYSLLASPVDPFDPMEKAIAALGQQTLADTEHLHHDWRLLREYPLSPQLLAMSRVWQSPDGQDLVIAAKGAPEAIAELCHLDAAAQQALHCQVNQMADEGLRVLAVARAQVHGMDLPAEQHDFSFAFMGLLGLSDPVRPEVAAAVQECYAAGIRVVMITGDYPGTARNIARQIGLEPLDTVITGTELDAMDDAQLRQRIRTAAIFARAVPEQKLRLVQALKANGEVVAMTGDGVNDAPALKAAHIGIAMGGRGTDVAREAGSLVLLDDNFASIVQAVGLGRRIFDNLKKAMTFIFSVHIPIAGMSFIPVVCQWPLALLPVHILFLELIIDPACTLVFEMERDETDVMRRPPRRLSTLLFGRQVMLTGLVQGLGVLLVVVTAYALNLTLGYGEDEARMAAFVCLVFGNLGLIFTNRFRTRGVISTLRVPNPALWWVTGGTILLLATVLAVPFLRGLFRFAPMHAWECGLVALGCLVSVLVAESVKTRPAQRVLSLGGFGQLADRGDDGPDGRRHR